MSKIKIIFFDIGGTLLSSDTFLFRNIAAKLNNHKLETILRKSFHIKKKGISTNNFKTIIQILAEILIENRFPSIQANEVARNLYKKSFVTNGKIYPDTLPTLKELAEKKIRLGVISDADWDILKLELEKFGLLNYFSHFAISSKVQAYKPSKQIFEYALRLANVSAKEALHVGDMPEDISGPKNIGIKSVLINRLNRDSSKLKIKPDFEISSLSEINKILKFL